MDVAARFRREGERGSRLDHESLLKVFAYCENTKGEAFDKGLVKNPFLLMEYMPGKTLESYIRHIPDENKNKFMITAEKLEISTQIARALEHLHKQKLVHRDVKPANIFLFRSGEFLVAKLGDFGIMKWGDFYKSLTTGVLTSTNQKGLGTLKYMSPEQAIRPRDVTVKSDIYSFGITLFELFTGQILAGPHHVTAVMLARLQRGTTFSRYSEMQLTIKHEDQLLAELILDMHLRGQKDRPSIDKINGNLEYTLERTEGSEL